MTREEIREKFIYHPPSQEGAETHGQLSEFFIDLAEQIEDLCPDSREKSVAFTHLETAKMWASAAVARNPGTR